MSCKIDLTGQRFGRLVVLEEAPKNKREGPSWVCRCDCGNICVAHRKELRRGDTKSCGCWKKETLKNRGAKHNKKTQKSWRGMMNRCYDSKDKRYPYYGGRGIKVCDKWHNFENFYEDMGDKPEGLTLERVNTNGDYEPSNCKWATWKEQHQNQRARGYSWIARVKKWRAHIQVDHKPVFLGLFNTPEEARQAYIEAKWKYHGVWLDE